MLCADNTAAQESFFLISAGLPEIVCLIKSPRVEPSYENNYRPFCLR